MSSIAPGPYRQILIGVAGGDVVGGGGGGDGASVVVVVVGGTVVVVGGTVVGGAVVGGIVVVDRVALLADAEVLVVEQAPANKATAVTEAPTSTRRLRLSAMPANLPTRRLLATSW